jgi:hypothetical protein
MPPEYILQKLAGAGIHLLPIDLDRHFLFERDGFVALVERRGGDALGNVGAAGLLTETGLSPLVWRGDAPAFAGKAGDRPATPEQVEALRRFQGDLESALRLV